MSDAQEKKAYYEQLAKELFTKQGKDLPPVDDVIRALEIAKGTKFRLSPDLVKRVREASAVDKVRREDDWCEFCDDEKHGDKCPKGGCDAFDCMPGLTPDS